MSFFKVEMDSALCDNCKELFRSYHNDFTAFPDESSLKSYMEEEDWITEDGKHYCPDCAKMDDGDQLVIDKSRFKEEQQ